MPNLITQWMGGLGMGADLAMGVVALELFMQGVGVISDHDVGLLFGERITLDDHESMNGALLTLACTRVDTAVFLSSSTTMKQPPRDLRIDTETEAAMIMANNQRGVQWHFRSNDFLVFFGPFFEDGTYGTLWLRRMIATRIQRGFKALRFSSNPEWSKSIHLSCCILDPQHRIMAQATAGGGLSDSKVFTAGACMDFLGRGSPNALRRSPGNAFTPRPGP